MIAAIRYTI